MAIDWEKLATEVEGEAQGPEVDGDFWERISLEVEQESLPTPEELGVGEAPVSDPGLGVLERGKRAAGGLIPSPPQEVPLEKGMVPGDEAAGMGIPTAGVAEDNRWKTLDNLINLTLIGDEPIDLTKAAGLLYPEMAQDVDVRGIAPADQRPFPAGPELPPFHAPPLPTATIATETPEQQARSIDITEPLLALRAEKEVADLPPVEKLTRGAQFFASGIPGGLKQLVDVVDAAVDIGVNYAGLTEEAMAENWWKTVKESATGPLLEALERHEKEFTKDAPGGMVNDPQTVLDILMKATSEFPTAIHAKYRYGLVIPSVLESLREAIVTGEGGVGQARAAAKGAVTGRALEKVLGVFAPLTKAYRVPGFAVVGTTLAATQGERGTKKLITTGVEWAMMGMMGGKGMSPSEMISARTMAYLSPNSFKDFMKKAGKDQTKVIKESVAEDLKAGRLHQLIEDGYMSRAEAESILSDAGVDVPKDLPRKGKKLESGRTKAQEAARRESQVEQLNRLVGRKKKTLKHEDTITTLKEELGVIEERRREKYEDPETLEEASERLDRLADRRDLFVADLAIHREVKKAGRVSTMMRGGVEKAEQGVQEIMSEMRQIENWISEQGVEPTVGAIAAAVGGKGKEPPKPVEPTPVEPVGTEGSFVIELRDPKTGEYSLLEEGPFASDQEAVEFGRGEIGARYRVVNEETGEVIEEGGLEKPALEVVPEEKPAVEPPKKKGFVGRPPHKPKELPPGEKPVKEDVDLLPIRDEDIIKGEQPGFEADLPKRKLTDGEIESILKTAFVPGMDAREYLKRRNEAYDKLLREDKAAQEEDPIPQELFDAKTGEFSVKELSGVVGATEKSVPFEHGSGRLAPTEAATARKRALKDRLKFWKRKKLPKRHDAIQYLSDKLSVPIRTGKFREHALGIYKILPRVIRLKRALDYEVTIHEIAHHVERLVGLTAEKGKGTQHPAEVRKLAYEGAKNTSREGFAEFLRIWVTNPPLAEKLAPEFTKSWEKELAKHGDVQDALLRSREYWNAYLDADSVTRWKSMIVSGKDGKRHFPHLEDIYMELVDERYPIRMVEKFAEKQGAVISPQRSPYLLAWLLNGNSKKAEQYLKFGTFKNTPEGIQFTGDSLYQILHKTNREGKISDLDAWMAARSVLDHAPSLAGFSGIQSREELLSVAARLEKENPDFPEVYKKLLDFQHKLLDYMADSGRLSKKIAQEWKDRPHFYTPLHRLIEERTSGGRLSRRKLADIGQAKSAKKRRGSSRPIISPIESIIYNVYEMINIADRNTAAVALVELAEKTPGLGHLVEKIPFKQKKVFTLHQKEIERVIKKFGKWIEHVETKEEIKTLEEEIKELGEVDATFEVGKDASKMQVVVMEALKNRGWTEGEADNIIRFLVKGMKDAEKGVTTEEKVKLRKQIITKTVEKVVFVETFKEWGVFLPEEGVSMFRLHKQAGPNEMVVWKDGEAHLYELAPELVKAIKYIDPTNAKLIANTSRFFTKMFRRTTTTLSIKFGIRNPFRDQFTAMVQGKYGTYIPFVDLIKGLGHMVGKTETYQEFMASGAAHGGIVSMDRPYISRKIMPRIMKDQSLRSKLRILNPVEAVGLVFDAVEALEEGTRVGAFAKAKKVQKKEFTKFGYNPKSMDIIINSAIEARDISLDFQRAGITGKFLNQHIAFWNPNIQGYDKSIRSAFKRLPNGKIKVNMKTMRNAFLGITLPTIMNWYWHKDDPEYHNLEPWRRTLFWNFKVDGEWYMVPKPFEWGIFFGTIPEMILDQAYYKDPRYVESMMKQIFKTQAPGFVPTLAEPIIEGLANRDFFFDRPIVPRGRQDLLPEDQYGPYTPEVIKMIAEVSAKIPLVKETWLSTPAKLENLITGYTSSFGRHVLYLTDQLLQGADLVKIGPHRTFKRDIMEELGLKARVPSAHSWAIQRFYEVYDKESRVYRSARAKLVEESGVLPTQELHTLRPPELQHMDQMAGLMKMSRAMIKYAWGRTEEEMSTDEKMEFIDTVYRAMSNMARAGLYVTDGTVRKMHEPKDIEYDFGKWTLPSNGKELLAQILKGVEQAEDIIKEKK